jgi:DNA polymerase-4
VERHVLHVNLDDFYASVARVKDPTLRRRPLIVSHLHSRGTVVSASYEARAEGVRPGLTLAQARRLAPRARVVPYDAALFARASDAMLRLLVPYSPLVERTRVDEAFLDYTGCERLLGGVLDVCARIQREIRDRLRLETSIGLATNKLVSQVASGAAKRAGLVDVYRGYESAFLGPHPVDRLPGVGPKLAAALRDLGVGRIGEIPPIPIEAMTRVFGRPGRLLHERARGLDPRPVRERRRRTVLAEEEAFEPDVLDRRLLEAALVRLVARLGARLRAGGVAARRLSIRVRYADGVEEERRGRLPDPEDLDPPLFDALAPLCHGAAARRVRVRALAVRAGDLRWSTGQLDLLSWRAGTAAPSVFDRGPAGTFLAPVGASQARRRRLCAALDALRARFGEGSVVTGRELSARAVEPDFS